MAYADAQFYFRQPGYSVTPATDNGGGNSGGEETPGNGEEPKGENIVATMQSSTFGLGDTVNLIGSVTGASEAVTWTVHSGSLGPFILAENGVISGTASTPGTWSAVLKVANSRGETTTPVSITVAGPLQAPPLAFYAIKGSEIAPVSISATGGVAPYRSTIVNNNLPDGLSLSGLTVSGTVSSGVSAGNYSSQVKVEDDRGQSKDTTVTVNVVDELNIDAPATPNNVYRGRTYNSFPITITGGINPQVTFASGSDAAGLTLSNTALSGSVSSVPNLDPNTGVGSMNLTFDATDGSGQSKSISRTFQVYDFPSFRLSEEKIYKAGDQVNITFMPTGVSAESAPARFTFHSTSFSDGFVGISVNDDDFFHTPWHISWLSVDPSKGTIKGTVPAGISGSVTFRFLVADRYRNKDTLFDLRFQ
ncbi:putative Ig domain-containing protein [Mesorhizobium sp. SP-1A]|uniref:putative Ig domain-containing protein n=1 Tax=Mesorhizobium sp. SP-1A TaxID=3077840 RepID=UPI0028F71AE2|nr:putative Ig domain-containing protein [Mesorhizobium sp. SP-1A]